MGNKTDARKLRNKTMNKLIEHIKNEMERNLSFISTMNDDYIHGYKDCYETIMKTLKEYKL